MTLINDQYRLIKQLDKRDSVITYLAEDSHHPAKEICVVKKFLVPAGQPFTQKEFERIQQKFDEEVAVSSGNEQVSTLLNYFEEEGDIYWVREWIEGQPLAQWQHPLEPGLMVEILYQTLYVLDDLHHRKTPHLNLSPSNIIWRERDSKVVLTDFRTIQTDILLRSHSLKPGPHIIPFSYRGADIIRNLNDPRSDFYSLGLTMITLMTGNSLDQIGQDINCLGEVSIPHDICELNPTLANILERMTRYDRQDRFKTVPEILAALQGVHIDKFTL